ncbi:Phage protein [Pseudomonas sp. R4-39-08]|uniref:hypothetical protein n=1 Tax=Pseudomonas sp. R4-39-08 TaxID=1173288 RepID=UPI000F5641BC|nr:hypothetical protein [Pseudomonas sp. R4-39-08]AZF38405.1 Phage protein [Pseudomonas sp. R4-39-08]
MIEKVGHIKNPLTVIAVFAAIAEVSGAVVLPMVKESVQETYVWFLMGFPCFLVFLFFMTLWWRHHVLYAPSDFKEDESFMTAHFRGGKQLSYIELPVDSTATADLCSAMCRKSEMTNELRCDVKVGDEKVEADVIASEEMTPVEPHPDEIAIYPKMDETLDSKMVRILAKQRVVRQLAHSLNGEFKEKVVSKQLPNITFDAVIETPSRISVVGFVEFKENRSDFINEIELSLTQANIFWNTLGEIDKARFVYHLAMMCGPNDSPIKNQSVLELVKGRLKLPFKTEVSLYEYSKGHLNAYHIS